MVLGNLRAVYGEEKETMGSFLSSGIVGESGRGRVPQDGSPPNIGSKG